LRFRASAEIAIEGMFMDLFLIRHAEAAPLGEGGVTEDSERPLTEMGQRQAAAVGQMLARHDIRLDALVSSPLVRAQQTATILLAKLGKPQPELLTTEELSPGAKPRKLAKFLREVTGERIGLVGHMPHIAVWAGWLIGAKKCQLEFAKAGVACIFCGDMAGKGLGSLQWLVTPEWFG
jgi:phosphohistidine phosphatase